MVIFSDNAVYVLAGLATGRLVAHVAVIKEPCPISARPGRTCHWPVEPPKAEGLLATWIGLPGKVPIVILVGFHPLAALVGDVIGRGPADRVFCPGPGISQDDALPLFVEEHIDKIAFPGSEVPAQVIAALEVLQDRQFSTIIAFAGILLHSPVTHHHSDRIEAVVIGLFMPLYVIYCTDLEPDLAVDQTFGLIQGAVLIARNLNTPNHIVL